MTASVDVDLSFLFTSKRTVNCLTLHVASSTLGTIATLWCAEWKRNVPSHCCSASITARTKRRQMKSGVGKHVLFVEHTSQLILWHLVFIDVRDISLRLVMEKIVRDKLQPVLHGFSERLVVVHAEEDLAAIRPTAGSVDKHVEERL